LWYPFTERAIKVTTVSVEAEHCCQHHTKFFSNVLVSRLTPYGEEIVGDHQCGFRRNKSTTDQIFYNWHILETKCGYNGTVHQLFIDFKKVYDSVRREVLYNIFIEFGTPRKLVWLIEMCLNDTYGTMHIGI
jgi:hypothetical protein